MKIEKITNPDCFCDFSHGAVIKTESGRSLGATCDREEAETIIRTYFQTEFFPEPVHVFFWRGNWAKWNMGIHFQSRRVTPGFCPVVMRPGRRSQARQPRRII